MPVAEAAVCTRMATGMALRGAPLRLANKRPSPARRVAVKVQAVASAVKPSAPAKKGDLISAEQAKELYRDMVLGREFEEMCAQMYYRGKMFGFVHLYSGQEAVSTGKPWGTIALASLPCSQFEQEGRQIGPCARHIDFYSFG